MPGERARIGYGLKALSDREIRECLSKSIKTVESLGAMAKIFPESVMPTPNTKYCVRCQKNYDERFPQQKVCRMEHDGKFCHTKWDGQHCYRCDGDFDLPDHYRGRNAPDDVGKWCFEGEHTQDEDVVKEEKWDADRRSFPPL
jgi:hypothetical protein